MLKPDAPTRRRIITDKNKMNLDVHKQRRKMLKQGAPTRRRIIPQKMKPRCPNKRDESILKQDASTREMKVFSKRCFNKGEMKVFSTRCINNRDENILNKMYQKG